ncbi:MAG: mechanosensitive ion channel family protein [Candidatus Paceibacterota bacterium]
MNEDLTKGVDVWIENINESFLELWEGLAYAIPQIVVAVLILVIGWLIAIFIGRVVSHVIKTLQVDDALRQAGVEDIVHRAGMTLDSGYFFGTLVKWFIIIAFLVATLNFLGLERVNDFILEDLLFYIPQIIIATLVIFLAALVADVLKKIVVASSKAASMASAELLGGVVKWSIWVFAIFVALDHLRIIPEAFIQTILQGFVIAFSLAVGLSFGLGGQKFAADYIEKFRRKDEDEKKK